MKRQLSLYEIGDIMERVAIAMLGGKTPQSYGDPEKYTSMEAHTVGYIADHPGCTVTEIASEWQKSKSAVSQLLKKLKKAELVRTEVCKHDEKQMLLFLTTKGKMLDAKHREYDEYTWGKALERLKEKYSEEEINTCFLILEEWLNIGYSGIPREQLLQEMYEEKKKSN